jgi:tetratricopeptide (TPR) repeat protein
LNDHPSREELAAFCRGALPQERDQEVLRHLLAPCPECRAEAPPPSGLHLASKPGRRPAAAEEEGREGAIGRAEDAARRHETHLRQQRAEALKILTLLEQGGVDAADKLLPRTGSLARMEAFLARSWQVRHDDPRAMVRLAWLAVKAAEQLAPRQYGADRVVDFQARAHAELGNAYRAADQLSDAQDHLGRARQLFERGTREPLLEIRLLELEGSLAADYRQFGRASAALLKVLDFHSRRSDFHLAGRALVKIAIYTGYAGDPDQAVLLTERSLALVDAERDPSLARAAAHNLILFLIEGGRFREARRQRLRHARQLSAPDGRIQAIKFQLLDARMDAGLGHHARAEPVFREVIAGYEAAELPILASIERLQLAAILLAQGKSGEAAALVLEAAAIFTRLRIQREALMAVIMLRDATEMRTATSAMIEEVVRFLRRVEHDPALRFEGRAWEI